MWTGERVRQLRRVGHLSQSDLAAMLRRIGRCSVDYTTVSRWERGVHPVSAFYCRLLTEAERMLGAQEAGTERRTFLQLLAAGMTGFGLVDFERLAAPSVDAAGLEQAEMVSMALAAQRKHVPPEQLVPAVIGHLRGLEARLPGTAEVTARTALVAGIVLNQAKHGAAGYRAYALAVGLGSNSVKAHAINGQARIYEVAGDRASAITHQDHAVELSRGTAQLEAGILARRAELHAAVADDRAAMRDLDAAHRAVVGGPYEWHYQNPEDEAEIAAYRGAVLLTLGRHAEAVEALDWTLAHMDKSKVLWRARVAADRDRALAAN